MSQEHVRMAFERWHAAATAGVDMMQALRSICAPNCILHLQNGDSGPQAMADPVITQMNALFPDLDINIEHVITMPDLLLVQVTMSGRPSLIFQIARRRRVFHSAGAILARVNEQALIEEVWAYLNPNASLTFPPQSHLVRPEPARAEPGTEEDAEAVLAQWRQAATGPEFLARLLAQADPGCVVHATNGDVGGPALVEMQFAVLHAAFPDLQVTFEPGFVADDVCVAQFRLEGTHRGALGIAPASGARVASTGAIVGRVTEHRLVRELWVYLAPGMALVFPPGQQGG